MSVCDVAVFLLTTSLVQAYVAANWISEASEPCMAVWPAYGWGMGRWGCHGNISNPFGASAGVTSVGGNRRASTSRSWLSSSLPTSPTLTASTSSLTNVPSWRRQWGRSDKSRSKVPPPCSDYIFVIKTKDHFIFEFVYGK